MLIHIGIFYPDDECMNKYKREAEGKKFVNQKRFSEPEKFCEQEN